MPGLSDEEIKILRREYDDKLHKVVEEFPILQGDVKFIKDGQAHITDFLSKQNEFYLTAVSEQNKAFKEAINGQNDHIQKTLNDFKENELMPVRKSISVLTKWKSKFMVYGSIVMGILAIALTKGPDWIKNLWTAFFSAGDKPLKPL